MSYVSITTAYSLAGVDFLLLNTVAKTSLLQNTIVSTAGLLFVVSGTFAAAYVRRMFEFDADRIASKVIDPGDLISALERMATLNPVSDISGWRGWVVSHPPSIERIEKLRRLLAVAGS